MAERGGGGGGGLTFVNTNWNSTKHVKESLLTR